MRSPFFPAFLALAFVATACGDARAPAGPAELSSEVVFSHAPGHDDAHSTHMTGDDEVPANASRAQGQANFRLSADGTALTYKLIVANIQNVTQSHIHLASAGVNGPIVAWLYPSAPPALLIPGRSQGVLGEGTITAANLVGPLAGMTIADLATAIAEGRTYVNVHTSQLPPGEIRGQIR